MELINPYVESFLSQLRYSSSPEACKGIITFDEIKKELKRDRVTNQMIDVYRKKIERRGIEVEVDDADRVIYITVQNATMLILKPDQIKKKNEAIEHFIKYYAQG